MDRMVPERLAGPFFDFVWLGIGARMEAPALLSPSPKAARIRVMHVLRHWSHRKGAFGDVLDRFVAGFQKPGNLAGGQWGLFGVAAQPVSGRCLAAAVACRRAAGQNLF